MVKYCIYCGQDEPKGHHKDCPIVAGVPKMIFGISARMGDIEFNLNLGRVSQLSAIRGLKGKIVIGTGDEERNKRLTYEQIAFQIRRIIPVLDSLKKEGKRKIIGIFARKRLKDIDKEIKGLYEMAELRHILKKEVDELWNQKIMLANYSGKEHIPILRDTKTMDLIYAPVE